MSEEQIIQTPVDDLRKQLEEEKKNRALECGQEINSVLEKYKCILDVKMVISKAGNEPEIRVVALDNQ